MTETETTKREKFRALLESRLDHEDDAESALAPDEDVTRNDVGAHSTLSASQRAMWLMWQSSPGDTAYNVPITLAIRGQVNRQVLVESVSNLADRHSILRTTIVISTDGEAKTKPGPLGGMQVEIRAIASRDVDAALRAEVNRPFDLISNPPMRAVLFEVSAGHHILNMTFHHIAVDAPSRAVILRDLAAGYNAAVQGLPDPPLPAIQYADLVSFDSGRPSFDSSDLAWWKTYLDNPPPPLDLPSDSQRSLPPWPAGEVEVPVTDDLYARVEAASAKSGCTPFILLLTALDIVLAKCCGTVDLVVGVPELGRPREDLLDVVGCFVNTMAIRTNLGGDPTGTETIRRTRAAALECFSRSDVPFESVVAAVESERDPRSSQLFQVMLNVYTAPIMEEELVGIDSVEDISVQLNTAKFDLVLHVVNGGPSGVRSSLTYRADMFERETAMRFGRWFRAVLEQLLAYPDSHISAIALEPNKAPAAVGPRHETSNTTLVHDWVRKWSRSSPDAVAVAGEGGSLTYGRLDAWSDDIASQLVGAKVGRGQPVGLLFDRNTALVAAMVGILKAGAYFVPIDPKFPSERIVDIITFSGIETVLTQSTLANDVPAAFTGRVLDACSPPRHNRLVAECSDSGLSNNASTDDPAYVLFTSGSTGVPKGVVVQHGSLSDYLQGVLQLISGAVEEKPSFALVSTFAADLGFTNLFGALATGGTVHVLGVETAVDPAAFAGYLVDNRVDVIKMVPSHLHLLAAHGDLEKVLPEKLLILAGEACPWSLVERVRTVKPKLKVQVHYGPTETTVSVLGGDVDDVPESRRRSIVPLGKPMANVVCYVVDAQGIPVPAGVAGELLIGGPSVARGYLGRPDLTASTFVQDPISGTTRCYRTGDRVRVSADGSVEFLGRLDDQIKIQGFRVELSEVQAKIRAIDGVVDAIVLPGDSSSAREHVNAWVSGFGLVSGDIRRILVRQLPDYMVPSGLTVLDRLPLTANGKIDRTQLPAPVVVPTSKEHRSPETETERRVAAVWMDVLDLVDCDVTGNFFAQGGDSFLALQAVRAIDPELRIVDLMLHPTVESIADLIDGRRSADAPVGMLQTFHKHEGADRSSIDLICVPYGGGTASSYYGLAQQLESSTRLFAAELPGHDVSRTDEPLLSTEDVVDRLAAEIGEKFNGRIAIYGHSAGAVTAVALALELESRGCEVVSVIVGARLADSEGVASATDAEYQQTLKDMGVFAGRIPPGAETTMTRNLRHDADQARTWLARNAKRTTRQKLSAPLLCVVGKDDPGTRGHDRRYLDWHAFAERVDLAVIPDAGHNFLKDQTASLAALIESQVGII